MNYPSFAASLLRQEQQAIINRMSPHGETFYAQEKKAELIRKLEREANTTSWAWRNPSWKYPEDAPGSHVCASVDALKALWNEGRRVYVRGWRLRDKNRARAKKPAMAAVIQEVK